MNKNYDEAKIACKSLRKRCLQWLLYFEYEFYCNVFKERIPESEIIASVFGFSQKRYDKFLQNVNKKLPKNRFVEQSYNEFLTFKKQEDYYRSLSVKNIAVCSTMSIGKISNFLIKKNLK